MSAASRTMYVSTSIFVFVILPLVSYPDTFPLTRLLSLYFHVPFIIRFTTIVLDIISPYLDSRGGRCFTFVHILTCKETQPLLILMTLVSLRRREAQVLAGHWWLPPAWRPPAAIALASPPGVHPQPHGGWPDLGAHRPRPPALWAPAFPGARWHTTQHEATGKYTGSAWDNYLCHLLEVAGLKYLPQ